MAAFPHWTGRYTVRRRLVQLAFLAVFVVLPLFDLFRFDFPQGRLHLVRQEIWLDEWALLWLASMFAMWLVGAASLALGRVYCAYACPQTVFSEIAHDLDALARLLTRRWLGAVRPRAAHSLSLLLLGLLSVAVSVLFMGYFAPLPEVLSRFSRMDASPWVGAVGAFAALLAFLSFGLVRETFCRTACPYGLLQGVIEDGRSLHVRLHPAAGPCIECGACARVCPMEIDIRDGPFQIECTRCGSCIDSCDRVLGRLKPARPGILLFDLGGFSLRKWDVKRLLVGSATLAFGAALVFAVLAREHISLRLSPVYDGAGTASAGAGMAESRYLLRAANRTRENARLAVRLEGLPAQAVVEGLEDSTIPAGRERRFNLVVRVPSSEIRDRVTSFSWVFATSDGERRFPSTFFTRSKPT
jgi:polyferredoxin